MAVEGEHIIRRPSREWVYPLILGLPIAVFTLDLAMSGFLSENVADLVSRALIVNDRLKMELLGFTKPPLALFPLVIYPTTVAAAVLGALWLGILSYLMIADAQLHHRWMPLIVLATMYLTPVFVRLGLAHYAEALALLLLYASWRLYRHWTHTGITAYGFKAGMMFGLAELATPFALPLAVAAGAFLPVFRTFTTKKHLAAWLILVFPPLVSMLSWTLLARLFTGATLWPYPGSEQTDAAIPNLLLLSPLYLAVGLLILWRNIRLIVVYLIPLGLLGLAELVQWDFSTTFALALLLIFAADALREPINQTQRAFSILAAAVQVALLWAYVPWPSESESAPNEIAIGRTLSQAPKASVLAGGHRMSRLIAIGGSAEPFLLPIDDAYGGAMETPEAMVPYVLTCPDEHRLYRLYGGNPPEGYVQDWAWQGCRLYRRSNADPLHVQLPPDEAVTSEYGTHLHDISAKLRQFDPIRR